MAHSPQTKAKAVAAIIEGVPWDEVQRRHKVSKSILGVWLKELKTGTGTGLSGLSGLDPQRGLPARKESHREQFYAKLGNLMDGTMDMLGTWVKVAGDEQYVRKEPENAIALGDRVLDRVDSIVDKIGLGGGG